jgi:hypothetical protein
MPSTDVCFLLLLLSVFCRFPPTAAFAAITVRFKLPTLGYSSFYVR